MTPELAPPLLATTPHQREDASALDRFNEHCSPTRRFFSGTGFELNDIPAMIRYLDHWATAALKLGGTFVTTRGLSQADLVILNHDQVTRKTPKVVPTSPNYHTTPMGGRFSSRWI
ncbi:uncharacterized protein TNCV_1688141 [Trichonephila clavipes]|nr:uncharacterized protein TNCV_1688141 [Trichonephila clavipes]